LILKWGVELQSGAYYQDKTRDLTIGELKAGSGYIVTLPIVDTCLQVSLHMKGRSLHSPAIDCQCPLLWLQVSTFGRYKRSRFLGNLNTNNTFSSTVYSYIY